MATESGRLVVRAVQHNNHRETEPHELHVGDRLLLEGAWEDDATVADPGVLIVVPIGLAAAAQMDISAAPVLLAIAVFAAAALLTPVATPANLMVMEAAGYRFADYWKLGLPLLLAYGLVGILLVPLAVPFQVPGGG